MGLELEEAVYHLHSGAFEIASPADVRLFVETCLQLDQRGDRLPGLGSFGELADDRAVLAGAVEGLLYRHHRRVARRLPDELDDDVKTLVGMMDDDVLLPNCGEAIAAEVADALGKSRDCRG